MEHYTEGKIINNLKEVSKERMSVITAYRLSIVQYWDLIVVMDNSKAIEIRSHEDLVKHGGRSFYPFNGV